MYTTYRVPFILHSLQHVRVHASSTFSQGYMAGKHYLFLFELFSSLSPTYFTSKVQCRMVCFKKNQNRCCFTPKQCPDKWFRPETTLQIGSANTFLKPKSCSILQSSSIHYDHFNVSIIKPSAFSPLSIFNYVFFHPYCILETPRVVS